MTSALGKVAEAFSVLDMNLSADNYYLKSIALDLLEYTEIF